MLLTNKAYHQDSPPSLRTRYTQACTRRCRPTPPPSPWPCRSCSSTTPASPPRRSRGESEGRSCLGRSRTACHLGYLLRRLPQQVTTAGYHRRLPHVTTAGYHSMLPQYVTTAGYHSRLPQQVTTARYHSTLPQQVTTAGYHSRLPQQVTTACYHSMLPQRKSSPF